MSQQCLADAESITATSMIGSPPTDGQSGLFIDLCPTKRTGPGKTPVPESFLDDALGNLHVDWTISTIMLPQDSVSSGHSVENREGIDESRADVAIDGLALFKRATRDEQEKNQEPYQGTTVSRRAVPNLGLHLWPFTCVPTDHRVLLVIECCWMKNRPLSRRKGTVQRAVRITEVTS